MLLLLIVTVSIYAYALPQVKQIPCKSRNSRRIYSPPPPSPKKKIKCTKKNSPPQEKTKSSHISSVSSCFWRANKFSLGVTLWGLHYSKWCHHEWHSSQPSSLTLSDWDEGPNQRETRSAQRWSESFWNRGGATDKKVFSWRKSCHIWVDVFLGWQLLSLCEPSSH